MAEENDWDVRLFSCTDDSRTCCSACLFADNVEKIDASNWWGMCCVYCCLGNVYLCWIPQYFKREKFRQKYHLGEDPSCGDLPATLFCGPCAICQEARELESRGNSLKFISTKTLFQHVPCVALETE
ncbi:unnamed protein product [Rotaria socialis]|uniref:Uncharacterized protein n=1 Tax=Rotaria socialis TaxID=392032 RepID=A0A818P5T7_9BILA|nr:unnamed protein product [Rotaria socialis]CAF4794806.1 unnamed protein product [Rotaria socialis]